MTYDQIYSTLVAAISAALPTSFKLQLENEVPHAPTTEAYGRATLLPARPSAVSTHTNLLRGLLQLDLFFPRDYGAGAARELAASVLAAVPRKTRLGDINIVQSWQQPAGIDENRYRVPVIIEWDLPLHQAQP